MKPVLRIALLLCILFLPEISFTQWSKTSGPQGMNVTEFHQKGSLLFCGTSSHGVFKSTNHGTSWAAANAGIENLSVFSLFSDDLYLYAGTNDGVYRSANNGVTWSAANAGIEGNFIYSFLQSGGYLFAGSIGSGLFKSNDHGDTWTDASGGALGSSSIYAIGYASPNLLVLADNNVFYSTDNGNSWFYPVTSPFTFTVNPIFVVHGDSVLLNGGFDVFRSFDSGLSWGPPIVIEEEIDIAGMMMIGNKVVGGSSEGIYFSKNFGATWQHLNGTGLRSGNRFCNHFYRSGNNFLLSFDEIGVAYSSNKGSSWQYTLTGFPPASTVDNALFITPTSLLSGTHSDGVYRTMNDGDTWNKIGTANVLDILSNGIIFSIYQSGSIILAGTCGDGLYRSADNGLSWTHITAGLPVDELNFLCINGITKSGSKYIAASDQGVYYSNDNGLTWNNSNIAGSGFVAMSVAANGTTAVAVVNRFTGNNEIYRSTNSGVTWNVVFSSLDDFLCVASDAVDHFYVGSFTNNYVSSTNGASWSFFGPGIPTGNGSFTLAVSGDNVFSGNSTGIYFSDDQAANFVAINEGLDPDPNMSVQGIAISDEFVFAGLFQNAVWKRPLSDFGIELKESIVSDTDPSISISPNPVSVVAEMNFQLPLNGTFNLTIYDASGKVVNHQLLQTDNNGTDLFRLDVSDLIPGIYFATVSQNEYISSVKFSVTK